MLKDVWLKKEFRVISILIIISFTIRFIFLMFFNHSIGVNDEADYVCLARNIVRGEGFTRDNILMLYEKEPIHSADHLRSPLFPFLIAVFFFFMGIEDMPPKIISLIFGVFLILPAYFLGKRLFNKNVGIACAFLVTFDPFLIEYSTFALTDSMSAFFITITAYYALIGLEEESKTKFGISGLLAGLSYLTRSSNIVFVLIFAIWAFVYKKINVFKQKYIWFFFFSFFVTISPWLIRNFLIFGNPFYSSIGHGLVDSVYLRMGISKEMILYNPNQAPLSLTELFVMNPLLVILGWLNGARILYFLIGRFLGPIKIFLILFGGIYSIRKYQRNFILYLPPIFFFCIFALSPDWRYMVPVLPIIYVLGGNGIIELKNFTKDLIPSNNGFNKLFRPVLTPRNISLIFLGLLLVFDFGNLSSAALHAQERMQMIEKYKKAGQWIEMNASPSAIIMARKMFIGWYSDRAVVPPPTGDYDELLRVVRFYNVSYLLISDLFVQLRPSLNYLIDIDKAPDNLRLIYSDLEGYRIIIYEITA